MYNLLDRKIQEQDAADEDSKKKRIKKESLLLAVLADPVHTCDCPTFYCNACSPTGCCNLRSLRDHL